MKLFSQFFAPQAVVLLETQKKLCVTGLFLMKKICPQNGPKIGFSEFIEKFGY